MKLDMTGEVLSTCWVDTAALEHIMENDYTQDYRAIRAQLANSVAKGAKELACQL